MTVGRFRLVSALLFAALAVAVGFALSNLRKITDAPLVDIAVPSAAVQADGELLRGHVDDGLPPYQLH